MMIRLSIIEKVDQIVQQLQGLQTLHLLADALLLAPLLQELLCRAAYVPCRSAEGHPLHVLGPCHLAGWLTRRRLHSMLDNRGPGWSQVGSRGANIGACWSFRKRERFRLGRGEGRAAANLLGLPRRNCKIKVLKVLSI